jgi:hypothetical protein
MRGGPLQQFDTVHAFHDQIAQDEIEGTLFEKGDRCRAGGGGVHDVAVILQQRRGGDAEGLVVVYNQNAFVHSSSLVSF